MTDEEVEYLSKALLDFFAPDRGPAFVITNASMAVIVDRLSQQLREAEDRRAVLLHWARHAAARRLAILEEAANLNPPARLPQGLALLVGESQGYSLTAQPTPNYPDM